MVLAVVSAETGGARSPIVAIGAMALVLGAAAIAIRLGRRPVARTLQHLHLHGGGLAAMLGLVLLVAWVFQAIGGLARISGAYAARLLVAGSPLAEKLRDRLVHAREAMLVPLLFVCVVLST